MRFPAAFACAIFVAAAHSSVLAQQRDAPLVLSGHFGSILSAAFSPDGRRIVTASFDGAARLWDAQTGKPIAVPLEHKHYLGAASFSPDRRAGET